MLRISTYGDLGERRAWIPTFISVGWISLEEVEGVVKLVVAVRRPAVLSVANSIFAGPWQISE